MTITQITVNAGVTEPSKTTNYGSIRRDVSFTAAVKFEQDKKSVEYFAKRVKELQGMAAKALAAEMKRAHRAEAGIE